MTPDQLLDRVAEQFNFVNWTDLKDNAFPIDAETVASMIKFGANIYAGAKIDELAETQRRKYPTGIDNNPPFVPVVIDTQAELLKTIEAQIIEGKVYTITEGIDGIRPDGNIF